MTPASHGWPFLVARGRRTVFRTVLAPQFVFDEGLEGLLAGSTSDGSTAPRLVNLDEQRLSIGYVSEGVALAEVEAPGRAGEVLTDEHGRPIEIRYGIVSRDHLQHPLDPEDLRMARSLALTSYRRLLDDEDGFRRDAATAIALRTAALDVGSSRGDQILAWLGRHRPIALAALAFATLLAVVGILVIPGGPAGPAPPLATSVLAAPQAVPATDGRRHVVYELRLRNATRTPVRVDTVEVRGDDGARLATYRGTAIARLTGAGAAKSATAIPAAGQRTLFLDVRLRARRPQPARLVHRFAVTIARSDGGSRRTAFTAARADLSRRVPPRLSMPLTGRACS